MGLEVVQLSIELSDSEKQLMFWFKVLLDNLDMLSYDVPAVRDLVNYVKMHVFPGYNTFFADTNVVSVVDGSGDIVLSIDMVSGKAFAHNRDIVDSFINRVKNFAYTLAVFLCNSLSNASGFGFRSIFMLASNIVSLISRYFDQVAIDPEVFLELSRLFGDKLRYRYR